jgi:hypothetical protein
VRSFATEIGLDPGDHPGFIVQFPRTPSRWVIRARDRSGQRGASTAIAGWHRPCCAWSPGGSIAAAVTSACAGARAGARARRPVVAHRRATGRGGTSRHTGVVTTCGNGSRETNCSGRRCGG